MSVATGAFYIATLSNAYVTNSQLGITLENYPTFSQVGASYLNNAATNGKIFISQTGSFISSISGNATIGKIATFGGTIAGSSGSQFLWYNSYINSGSVVLLHPETTGGVFTTTNSMSGGSCNIELFNTNTLPLTSTWKIDFAIL